MIFIKHIRQGAVLLLLVSLIVGCNVLQEADEQPVITANVLPNTAGSVLISGQGSENQQVELLAVANENWRFSNWSGDIESNENPLNITLSENTELFANFILEGNEYRVELELSDGENISELWLGQTAGATDGFDTDLDLEAPPPPPEGVLFARFEGADRNLLYDFRNPYTTTVEWVLNIESGNFDLATLSWEIERESSTGILILTDSNESFDLDMSENSSLELNLEETNQFIIKYLSID